MKIWLLSQNDQRGYDTFDSCVVIAETEEEAREISPDTYNRWGQSRSWSRDPSLVDVTLVGEAIEGAPSGILLASFNAG